MTAINHQTETSAVNRNDVASHSVQTAQVTEAGTPARPVYASPRIITHSTEKLQQLSHPVNACTSFVP